MGSEHLCERCLSAADITCDCDMHIIVFYVPISKHTKIYVNLCDLRHFLDDTRPSFLFQLFPDTLLCGVG